MSHGLSASTVAGRWGGAGLVGLCLVVGLRYLLDLSPAETAVTVVAVGTWLALQVAAETGWLADQRRRVGTGAAMLAAAGLFAAMEPPTRPMVGGAVGAGAVEWSKAVWAASGIDRDSQRARHAFAAGGAAMGPLGAVSRSVVDALEGRPRTRSELGAAVDAEADSLDRALNELQARGAVVRAGREYRLAEDDEPGFA